MVRGDGDLLSDPVWGGQRLDYYLNHTWDKVRNDGGAIFMDYRCAADFSSGNTLVYGHRMRNGSMFAGLKFYKDQAFGRTHPTVYVTDSAGVHAYDIFSAWEPSVTDAAFKRDFASQEEKQDFLDVCLEESVLDTGIVPGLEDQILTLSTCTGNGHATR